MKDILAISLILSLLACGCCMPKSKALGANPYGDKQRIELTRHYSSTFEYGHQPVLVQADFEKNNAVYIVKHDFNLMGRNITLPTGSVLMFDGGSMSNGGLIGDKTVILYEGVVFDGISISGTWNVPEIHSSMFGDATTEVNRLKDVIALTSPDVENKVYIDKGKYYLQVMSYSEHLLRLNSNTIVNLEGAVMVLSNSFPRYKIFSIYDCENVVIEGSGMIVGDKEHHVYAPEVPDPESKRGLNSSHEYGHGIHITNSKNITISGITITNCIGDGIFIEADDVTCNNLIINRCRRQGIAVVDGNDIDIHGCTISEIWGVNKGGFGIDIEPREEQSVTNVIISKCDIFNCNGGISCAALSFGNLTNVTINDCQLSYFARDTLDNHMLHRAIVCSKLVDCELKNCVINEYANRIVVYVEQADNFRFVNNILRSKGSQFGLVIRNMEGLIYVQNNKINMYELNSDKPYGVALTNLHNAVVADNEIFAGNLSYTADTPCRNIALKRNKIHARWEPGVIVSDSEVDDNIFENSVKIAEVRNTLFRSNKFQSVTLRNTSGCLFSSNRSLSTNRLISLE